MSRSSRRIAVAVAAALALSTVLAGCLPFPQAPVVKPVPVETVVPDEEEPTAEWDPAMFQEIEDAVEVVDYFWTLHWPEFYTGEYSAPYVGGAYDGLDPDDPILCSGDKPEPYNAFYCGMDDQVIWDVNLMDGMWQEGDALMYLIIAHEWGHAIQARLADDEIWAAKELQADCFAGAALYGAAADGILEFEDGDAKEIANGLVAIADEYAWSTTGDHGDPFDRIDAFNDGKNGGVTACYPQG